MKHGLADQCNIGVCIHLKGDMITIFFISCFCPSLMYSFSSYRFIGESKRSVKNKAKIEGSIYAAYLHYETTYFCSHYFKNFMLLPSNHSNEIQWQSETSESTLSVVSTSWSSRWQTVHLLVN